MTDSIVALWPAGAVPGALGADPIDTPTITVFAPPEGTSSNGAAVVVCPGGGYGNLAAHEGEPVARWLNTLGVTGIVLRYRLGPRYRHPMMLHDALRAVRTVRARAGEMNVDPNRVGVLGFSAGGHLASSVATHFDPGDPLSADPVERQSARPNLAILIYPVIALDGPAAHTGSRRSLLGENPADDLVQLLSNHRHVSPDTPPTFLVHSADDKGVPVQNSLLFAQALAAAGVPFALTVFEHGGHGYGMGKDDPLLTTWPVQCGAWMQARGFLSDALR